MAQVQRRDQEAFTRLLDRHLGGLQKFLLRLTGNAADADEVAQEAFLRIWSHARRWQADRVKFTTWLYRIARNLAIDRHRKHRESTTDDLTMIADDAPDAGHVLDSERRERADARRRSRSCRNVSEPRSCCVTSTVYPIRTRPPYWRCRSMRSNRYCRARAERCGRHCDPLLESREALPCTTHR